jgi:hypothetical protein
MGFDPSIPASERAKTVHVLDRAATVTGEIKFHTHIKQYIYLSEVPIIVAFLLYIYVHWWKVNWLAVDRWSMVFHQGFYGRSSSKAGSMYIAPHYVVTCTVFLTLYLNCY